MRKIVVTGGNKGIGRAIVERALEEHEDVYVYLGSRSPERGQATVDALIEARPSARGRLELLPLDVTSGSSVQAAADRVDGPLHGIVNNAGIGRGASLEAMLETNTRGVRRVCETFLDLLEPAGGRVVNVTSASGPMFVAKCRPERQAQLVDASIGADGVDRVIEEALAIERTGGDFAAHGLGSGDAYGLSKALANAYTLTLAKAHPALRVNACTPGYIATDLTLPEGSAKDPAELGMKPPREGATAPLFLLFGEPGGSGWYFGSDAKRSPLDRYRSPGDPPYTGD